MERLELPRRRPPLGAPTRGRVLPAGGHAGSNRACVHRRGAAMDLGRRKLLRITAGAAMFGLARPVAAQSYPTRQVRILVGFEPGGAADILARLLAQWLSGRLGQPFIVENRPGAGSSIATAVVVRAPADGYTLLLCSIANAVNATLYDQLDYNFLRDVRPVASLCRAPLVMEVHPSLPAASVPEFIAFAKANPGKLSVAS